jgi:hypothetical protein
MIKALDFLEKDFLRKGGSAKSFRQLKCFISKYSPFEFQPKPTKGDLGDRCNLKSLKVSNRTAVGIIDFTRRSDENRFFIFDLRNLKLHTMPVAHGRYGETSRSNDTLSRNPKQNSVLQVIHFSNAEGINATSGGFHLTGLEYQGGFGRSLILHGLEQNQNDNSCSRAVVIHPSVNVNSERAKVMSSGCPMVSRSNIDLVVSKLKGGAILYHFTPEELRSADTDCGQQVRLLPKPMS